LGTTCIISALLEIPPDLCSLYLYDELSREKRRLCGKLTRRLLHLNRDFASHLVEILHELGVSTTAVMRFFLR